MFKSNLKNRIIFLLILLLSLTLFSKNNKTFVMKNYAKINIRKVADHVFLRENQIDVDRSSIAIDGSSLQVYVTEEEFNYIKDTGLVIKWNIDPRSKEEKSRGYRTNEEIGQEMANLEALYPDICKRITIGNSVQGREMWVMKISDNIDIEEAEPEVKFTSTMHGDEVTGEEMNMELIYDILEGYSAGNDTMTFIVNNTELYVMPLHNPDGMANDTRYNAEGIDLNRNFPERTNNDPNDPTGKALENQHVMNWTADHNFVLSYNMHGGALVVNYPWDQTPGSSKLGKTYSASFDDETFIWLSLGYSIRNTPMYNSGSFTNGITNGAAWYEITGGMQDWNYHYHSSMEVCLEISDQKWPPFSQIAGFWQENRSSMLWYLMGAHKGIKGIVTNSETGNPVAATIKVSNNDKSFYADSDLGDYIKILKPGTYDLYVTADGYNPQIVEDIVVTDPEDELGTATVVNVELVPLGAPVAGLLTGNIAAVGNNMILNLEVSTANPIDYVMADYTIDGVTETIEMTSVTDELFNYTCDIPAQNEEKNGTVRFRLRDTLGNESESENYTISWLVFIVEDFETGDFSAYNWGFGGNSDWQISNSEYNTGSYSAKSGAINNNQTTELAITREGLADVITFFVNVSSENNYDYLKFYIDGNMEDEWEGEVSWSEQSYSVSAGEHTYKWSYEKDGSQIGGSDCAWIDDITFPASPNSIVNENSSISNFELKQNYPNPFNPVTKINYTSAQLSVNKSVEIVVYNSAGQQVWSSGNLPFTIHHSPLYFDGSSFNSGIYYYSLIIDGKKMDTKSMVLIK